jgi:hypothetical protein
VRCNQRVLQTCCVYKTTRLVRWTPSLVRATEGRMDLACSIAARSSSMGVQVTGVLHASLDERLGPAP